MTRLKLLTQEQIERAMHDGTPPLIEVLYGVEYRYAVLERNLDNAWTPAWAPVEVEI